MENELAWRLVIITVIVLWLLGWEYVSPRRPVLALHRLRQANNFLLIFSGVLLTYLIMPVAVVGAAMIAESRGWGVLRQIPVNGFLAVCISVILLDLVIYLQHRIFHKVHFLWCIHRVHHTDTEVDVTTAIRFHPIEILLSVLLRIMVVVVVGVPVIASIIFEVLLVGSAMFNHSNIHLPVALDRKLRLFLVTPDMHRVHHSTEKPETDSNFGTFLPLWDRFFHTYRDQPAMGHLGMKIGLREFRGEDSMWVHDLLLQPFRITEPGPKKKS